MRKLLALILISALCVCCLVSCGISYTKNEFFSDEFLTQNKLTDMPLPPRLEDSVYGSNSLLGSILYLNLTSEEYEQYVEDLLNYLRAKEDIYYLGYSVGSGLLAEMLPYNEIAPITDSYDIKDDEHRFFFSTVDGLGNQNMLDTPVEIGIIREMGKLKFDDYEYNTQIILCDGYLASAMWNLCGAEHTYDEGIEYKIAGSDGMITEYTCVHCGSTKASDFIGDMRSYKITIEDTEADHYIIDRCDSAISGVIVGFKTQKIIDADLKFTVNGTEIYPRETDDDKWIYEFIMPCADVTVVTEVVTNS